MTELILFSDHFKSCVCFWTEISKAKFVCEIQSSESVVGGFFLVHNIYLLENISHEMLLLSVRGLNGKIISFIFPTGKELSLFLIFSLPLSFSSITKKLVISPELLHQQIYSIKK